MIEYSQGIMADGPVILKDGQPMTPEEIVAELTTLQGSRCPESPEGWHTYRVEMNWRCEHCGKKA